MKYVAYNWLVVEFLSLLNVDWVSLYRCQEVLITFRMFNADHKLSLREFNNLLHLPVHLDSFRDVPSQWRPDPFWLSITCSKWKSYINRFGWPRVYDSRQAKTTDICNVNICYL